MASTYELADRAWQRRRVTVPALSRTATIACLCLLFAAAGVDKLLHLNSFYLALRHYVLVPPAWAPTLTLLVPLLELWVAVGLVIAVWRFYAAAAAAVLLTIFALALAANHVAGVLAPCGCMFSLTLSEATMPHVAFNSLLAGLCVTLCLDRARTSAHERTSMPAGMVSASHPEERK